MPDILIVEDGLKERERLEKIFKDEKFSVHSAETASKAESLLEVQQYRLCVLDIGLSDKSGSLLFNYINRLSPKPIVLILTGNPSVFLKQKFIDEGAAGFILKASPEASNKNLIERVNSLLGSSVSKEALSIDLNDFLKLYVSEDSEDFFLNDNKEISPCISCESTKIIVRFSQKPQLPPIVEGEVVCQSCGQPYDITVGS